MNSVSGVIKQSKSWVNSQTFYPLPLMKLLR